MFPARQPSRPSITPVVCTILSMTSTKEPYTIWESKNGRNKHLQIVVPRFSISRVLHSIRDQVSGRHFGVTETVTKIRQRFYWPTYKDDIKDLVLSFYDLCCNQKATDLVVWQFVQIQCGTPIWKNSHGSHWTISNVAMGSQHILVVADYFSRWCKAYHK